MMCLKYYFKYNSFIRKYIADIFFKNYDIPNFLIMIEQQLCLRLIMSRGMNRVDHF